jgi:hypothetical protein
MKKAAFCLFLILPFQAQAHVGDHAHFDWAGMLAHLFELDHLFFAAVTILASVLAFRAGRRADARVHVRKDRDHDPR